MTGSFTSCVALVVLTPLVAHAQQSEGAIVERCITRDSATAWMRMSQEWSRETPGAWTNDSLRNVLIALALADQAVRPTTGVADSMKSHAFVLRMTRQDSIGAMAMREIVRRFGWPTKTMVGARGASAAFLIAQHNVGLQEEALRLMWALPPGEVQRSELAMLEDRWRVSRGEPQRYGTQVRADTSAMAEFYPIDSLARLGERRAEVGLPPMPVYLCVIRAMMGRAVRYPPEELQGPTARLRFRRYLTPHASVHVGNPQLASVALGGMLVMWRSNDLSRWSGILTILEPGVRAGKLRVGYGSNSSSGTGVSGTVSVLNNYGEGPWLQPWPVYAGVELHATGKHLDLGVGQYQSLKRGKLRFAVSLGVGL
jgi:hypothetical protein